MRRHASGCVGFAAALALLLPLLASPARAQTGAQIMEKERGLHHVKDEEERQLLRLVSKAGATKERRLVRWTLSGAGGLDKILVRFLAPRDVENTGLLTWEAKDGNDDQWLYLPSVRRPKRIASSGKKNRFMGTDYAYEDIRPESTSVNTYTLVGSAAVDGHDCFVLEAVPATPRQANDSGYSKRKLWVRKDNYTTLKREYYDKPGKLEKVETLKKFVNVKGTVWRANEIEMRDVQNGTSTITIIESRQVDRGLRDDFFTEGELIK